MNSKLLPLRAEHFDLSDEELGKLILGLWIMDRAENCGVDPLNIPQDAGNIIVEATQKLPDDHIEDAVLDSLMFAIRLAANGKFEAAGKKLKSYVNRRAEHMAAMVIVSNMDDDQRRGAKCRLSAKLGHSVTHGDPVEKESKRRKCLALMEDIRKSNPHLKPNAVHERAAAKSEVVLGEKLSSKTFQRIDKDQ